MARNGRQRAQFGTSQRPSWSWPEVGSQTRAPEPQAGGAGAAPLHSSRMSPPQISARSVRSRALLPKADGPRRLLLHSPSAASAGSPPDPEPARPCSCSLLREDFSEPPDLHARMSPTMYLLPCLRGQGCESCACPPSFAVSHQPLANTVGSSSPVLALDRKQHARPRQCLIISPSRHPAPTLRRLVRINKRPRSPAA